ncbi:choice-of-anchor B family protein [Massilia glaciei]|uniref:Choice-of-anchor B family protein n=1 Tax=Massilia glaciei TaxID=1524097 RepID=A0A2U2H8U4_9BURK|nr:choice-of-anchor B family protein [Massilia glaciei]
MPIFKTSSGHARPRLLQRGAAIAACAFALAACGGGGSGGPAPTSAPAPANGDFGGAVLGKVARTGVAGTWGYTAPDGKRYAIMGTAKGVLVLDLSNTASPRVVDEIDGPTNTNSPDVYWREMRVYGQHAYIVSEHTNVRAGIMILDLSGLPNSVRFVRSVIAHDGELPAHAVDIDTARGLLYLQRFGNGHLHTQTMHMHHPVGGPNQGSIEIWDLKPDPENPTYVSTFNKGKSVHDMTAVGNFAYVAEGTAAGYSIWNVENPAAPTLVVRWSVEPGHFAHNIWPSGDGSFVVTTEEIPLGLPARVWQLNGNAVPTLLSSFKIGTGTPHNVVMEGRTAYLSHYTEGAAVVDLSNPAVPRVVARVDTSALTGPDMAGCWGVYKFPGVPLMTCSDTQNGFHLIGITGN